MVSQYYNVWAWCSTNFSFLLFIFLLCKIRMRRKVLCFPGWEMKSETTYDRPCVFMHRFGKMPHHGWYLLLCPVEADLSCDTNVFSANWVNFQISIANSAYELMCCAMYSRSYTNEKCIVGVRAEMVLLYANDNSLMDSGVSCFSNSVQILANPSWHPYLCVNILLDYM